MYSGFLGRNFLNTLFFPRLFENTWMTANENKNREEPQNQNTTVKEAAKKLCRERRRSRLKSQGPRGRLDPDDFIHHPRHGQFGGQGEVVDEGNDRIPQIPCIHIQLLKHQNGQRQNFGPSPFRLERFYENYRLVDLKGVSLRGF